jgi:LPXTG-motif cell wall-anchored protein
VNATQDPTVANFSVDCGQSTIANVRFTTTEGGTVEGDSGTECTNVDQNTFRCQPTGDATGVITGQFTNALGDAVCAEPPLTIDFTVTFDDDSTEEINDVRVANCSQDSGGGGVVDTGEDNSRTPEGGVDSGAGGIRETGRRAGMAWALIAGASALGLGAVVLLARRRHRAG